MQGDVSPPTLKYDELYAKYKDHPDRKNCERKNCET